MNPEVLFELMSNVEGKSVLELGAASGENALLLGLAGAKEVFVNDIVKSEVKTFEKTIARLSSKEVREKFHAVAGDCLEIFESPEYEGRFDLIYARNFYHFFFGEKKDRLNALFKKLLKPKGLLVISTNSVNVLPESQRKANCFVYESLTPLVRLKGGNHKIAEPTYAPYELQANEEIDPLEYKFEPLMVIDTDRKLKTGPKFSLFPKEEQERMLYSMKIAQAERILVALDGSLLKVNPYEDYIECHSCKLLLHSPQTLASQFKGSGLISFKSYCSGAFGHRCKEGTGNSLTMFLLRL